ncbi:MAG TPA: hypothetical protein P5247_00510 [Candidatus Saccharimonadales bacterium]|nr:hypothetical protein [Candidatus Saccharimonadales bacterium]
MLDLSLINQTMFKFMKKLIILGIIILIFVFGVVFGKSWAQNSWITSAVNKGLKESGQTENAETTAKLNGLRDCELKGGIISTETGKEANLRCFNVKDEAVNLKASAVKNGKILIFQKYKFTGVTVQ